MDTRAVRLAHEESLSHLKPHLSALCNLVWPSPRGQFPHYTAGGKDEYL